MPIIIKDYVWEESDKMLFITVPLKGVRPNKVDIFSTENYIKVSYPPYMFECFLFAEVHDQKSAAQIGNGAVVFKLEKHDPVIWSQLHHPESSDKVWQKTTREAAITRSQERQKQQAEEKAKTKDDLRRLGINQQLEIENQDRSRIEDIKKSERDRVNEELEKWEQLQKNFAQEKKEKEEKDRKEREQERRAALRAGKLSTSNKKMNIFEQEAGDTPVRQADKINITFTPRVFPTPLRESGKPLEDEWLAKQAEARKIVEIQDSDLKEEERNPEFLKDKGDKFFKAGDLHAAINAYSLAIRFNPKLHSLYSNRAACHLKLGNLMKCAEDSDKALQLLTPAVEANAESRVKAHVRRGTALCRLELYVEGLSDYEAALKIDPSNSVLREDAEKIREIIQSSDLSRPVVDKYSHLIEEVDHSHEADCESD